MGYRILIIDKTREEGGAEAAEAALKMYKNMLEGNGYCVTTRLGWKDFCEREYSQYDCVIAHPPMSEAAKLLRFKQQNPHVGLVIIPSRVDDNSEEWTEFLEEDSDGTFIRWRRSDVSLDSAIKKVIKEAKSKK